MDSFTPLSPAFLVGGVLAFVYVLYRVALPSPIPGIPYHKRSAKSIFGDLPGQLKHAKDTGEAFSWMTAQCYELNSPIIQLFLRPFGKPFVLISDYRESYDIAVRRTKEFDRSAMFGDILAGVLPYHLVHMPSNEKWRHQRKLLADTMSPAFLNEVKISSVAKDA